jgi:hypothetical protein
VNFPEDTLLLGIGDLIDDHGKWQQHLKLASFSRYTRHFDAAVMFFHNAAG